MKNTSKVLLAITLAAICLAAFCSCSEDGRANVGDTAPEAVSTFESGTAEGGSVGDTGTADTDTGNIGSKTAPPETEPETYQYPGDQGGIYECDIHHIDYHGIPGELWTYVEGERINGYGEWLKTEFADYLTVEHYQKYGCNNKNNIMSFIEYTKLTREEFENIYYNTSVYYFEDYPIDLLYSDAEKAEEYFRNFHDKYETEYREKMEKRESITAYNAELRESMRNNADYSQKLAEVQGFVSLPELIYRTGLTREAAEKTYINLATGRAGLGQATAEIDFDALYNRKSEISAMIGVKSLVEINAAVIKDDLGGIEIVGADDTDAEKNVTDPVSYETEPETGEHGGAETGYCRHAVVLSDGSLYDNSYHDIAGTLIKYVGYEKAGEWLEKNSAEKYDGSCCRMSIYAFIKDFDIPREDFENIMRDPLTGCYFYDYDIDLLYGGNETAIEEYYSSGSARIKRITDLRFIGNMKMEIWSYIKNNCDSEFNAPYIDVSIQEAVKKYGIGREVIERFAKEQGDGISDLDLGKLYSDETYSDMDIIVDNASRLAGLCG